MKKRTTLRSQLKLISKPTLKMLWMIRKSKHGFVRRSSMLDGCAAILTEHDDILVEILARLPVKSLMRFRCVCTTWRSLIADPHFVKKHMKYNAERVVNDSDVRLLFSMKPPSTMGLADLKGLKDAKQGLKNFRGDRVPTRQLQFPVGLDFVSDFVSVGSCNGIICVQIRGDFVLWNPCTGDHNVLPKPSGFEYCPQYYGFGYDEVNDDYKVVKGTHNDYVDYGRMKPVIQVFSLRRGAWNTYPSPMSSRMYGDYLSWRSSCMGGMGGYMNGVLHWVRFQELGVLVGKEIMPFSLAEEKFLEAMPLPSRFAGIFIWRNHLCVHSDCGPVSIMMMKEYGVKESWTEVLYVMF